MGGEDREMETLNRLTIVTNKAQKNQSLERYWKQKCEGGYENWSDKTSVRTGRWG